MALTSVKKLGIKSFTIVFTTVLLMSVDAETYEKLVELLEGIELKMIVFDPIKKLDDQIIDKSSVVLIDEADHVLLDHAATLSNTIVYGVSATGVSQDSPVER